MLRRKLAMVHLEQVPAASGDRVAFSVLCRLKRTSDHSSYRNFGAFGCAEHFRRRMGVVELWPQRKLILTYSQDYQEVSFLSSAIYKMLQETLLKERMRGYGHRPVLPAAVSFLTKFYKSVSFRFSKRRKCRFKCSW